MSESSHTLHATREGIEWVWHILYDDDEHAAADVRRVRRRGYTHVWVEREDWQK